VEDLGIAQARANNLLLNIKAEVNSTEHTIFLSGGENFRKTIYPNYKANRNDQERPVYLEPLREWLVTEWGAKVTDGIEADDALGMSQTHNTVVCSLDKDLRQVPGWHYSWEIVGTSTLGKQWKKEASLLQVSEQEGMFNLYWQLVMGDTADNVPGFDGKMRQKVPKFLETHYETMQGLGAEIDIFEYVYDLYNGDLDRMLINGQCLYVLRHEEDNWLKNVQPLIQALGLREDIEASSPQP
jgi:5'-3' exonuclease